MCKQEEGFFLNRQNNLTLSYIIINYSNVLWQISGIWKPWSELLLNFQEFFLESNNIEKINFIMITLKWKQERNWLEHFSHEAIEIKLCSGSRLVRSMYFKLPFPAKSHFWKNIQKNKLHNCREVLLILCSTA